MKVLASALALPLVAALGAACTTLSSPSNNQNTPFAGIVTPETGSTQPLIQHNFSVSRTGEMSVRVTSISPNNASLIGLGLGQVINGNCGVYSTNTLTGLNREVFVSRVTKGTYCLQVYNGGGIAAPQSYELTVNHP